VALGVDITLNVVATCLQGFATLLITDLVKERTGEPTRLIAKVLLLPTCTRSYSVVSLSERVFVGACTPYEYRLH
jgi:hypothetical protein